jgi:thymidylate kinase
VRALAHEALTQLPTPLLAILLRDPIDAMVARQALERQANEFESREALRVLREFAEGFDETFD